MFTLYMYFISKSYRRLQEVSSGFAFSSLADNLMLNARKRMLASQKVAVGGVRTSIEIK